MVKKTPEQLPVPVEFVERRIFLIRGQKVMVDFHLAQLYGVTTRRLNEQVQRNLDRFPEDFAFQLDDHEFESLMSQIATSKGGRGGRRKLPWAFTEHGILMLSSVLRSDRAVQVNIAIMRAFVRLRQMLVGHKDLARKLDQMEKKYDAQFKAVFDAIRKLMAPPPPKSRRQIGFRSSKKG